MRKFILVALWAGLGAAYGALIGIVLMFIFGTAHADTILVSATLSGAISSASTYYAATKD